jgi:hypothetical protein
LALAFAERFCLEAAVTKLNSLPQSEAALRNLLQKAIILHCIAYIKENLGWYMMNGVISQKAA